MNSKHDFLKGLTFALALGVSSNVLAVIGDKQEDQDTKVVTQAPKSEEPNPTELLKQAQETLKQNEEGLATLKRQFEAAQKEVKEETPKKAAAAKELAQLKNSPLGKIAGAIGRDSVDESVQTMQQHAQALEGDVEKTSEEIKSLRAVLQSRETALKQAQQEQKDLKSMLSLIQSNQKTKEGDAFQQDLSKTQQQIAEKNGTLQQLDKVLTQAKAQEEDLKKQLTAAQNEVNTSKKAVQEATRLAKQAEQKAAQEAKKKQQAAAKQPAVKEPKTLEPTLQSDETTPESAQTSGESKATPTKGKGKKATAKEKQPEPQSTPTTDTPVDTSLQMGDATNLITALNPAEEKKPSTGKSAAKKPATPKGK